MGEYPAGPTGCKFGSIIKKHALEIKYISFKILSNNGMAMFRYVVKLFAVMFIVFLIVGNVTAPASLTADDVEANGVMGAFYHVGKFIVVPFENRIIMTMIL